MSLIFEVFCEFHATAFYSWILHFMGGFDGHENVPGKLIYLLTHAWRHFIWSSGDPERRERTRTKYVLAVWRSGDKAGLETNKAATI